MCTQAYTHKDEEARKCSRQVDNHRRRVHPIFKGANSRVRSNRVKKAETVSLMTKILPGIVRKNLVEVTGKDSISEVLEKTGFSVS